jgi:outer membrane receptor protein involved in Fe transport
VLLHDIDPDHQRLDNVNIAGPNYEQGETRLTFNYTRSLTPTLKLVEILGYRDVQLKFIKDGYEVGAPFDLTANTLTMRPFNDQTDESIFYEELRLELTPQFGQLQDSFVVGGSYERTSGKNAFDRLFTNADLQGWTLNYLTPVIPAENTWQHAPSSRTYHLGVGSFFGQYTFEPTPRVVIVGGARYDHLSMDADLDTGEGTDTSFDAFSPKVGATFRLRPPAGPDRPTLNLYGTYSRAFMPPLRPGTLMPGDPELNLDLEDVDNYEAGLKGTGFNRRLAFSGGFFWMKQSGIVAPTRQGDSIVQDNSGEQTYTGGEAEATWVFNDKITGYANAAIYHHRYGQFVIASDAGDPGDIVLTDNRLPTSPDYLFNLGAFVKIRPELDLIVDVKRTGPMPANPSNTYEIDGSTLVDAALSWRFRMLRFTLSAHNMLGDEYYALSDGSIADPGRPRQVILNAAVHVR